MKFTYIPCDMHLHTSFSEDSETPMEEMVLRAIGLGLKHICFTEHLDYDYHPEDGTFLVDMAAYHTKLLSLKNTYKDQIEILFGIEYGMQPQLAKQLTDLTEKWSLDYVIASQHLIYGRDPYYRSFWEGREEATVIHDYFRLLLADLLSHKEWHTCAHLDYLIRYLPSGAGSFDPDIYMEEIEPILKHVIAQSKTLEVNTAPFAKGLNAPNPSRTILKRYYDLGGRSITLGSDAHVPAGIGCHFNETADMLKEIGFTQLTYYRQGQKQFYPL